VAKTRSLGKSKVIELIPTDETIVSIDEIHIICLIQNELTGKLTMREISLGSEVTRSRKRNGTH
jgi:hypothetical protein